MAFGRLMMTLLIFFVICGPVVLLTVCIRVLEARCTTSMKENESIFTHSSYCKTSLYGIVQLKLRTGVLICPIADPVKWET